MSKILMSYLGFYGSCDINFSDNVLHGKIECINDLVTFESNTPDGLKREFEYAVDDYLETCREINKSPDKSMSGSFNIRIGEKLHKDAFIAAKKSDRSLNDFIKSAVENKLYNKKHLHFHTHIEKPDTSRSLTMQNIQSNPRLSIVPSKTLHIITDFRRTIK
jgi:predicted HicB family RNase H-like nuclease